MKSVGILSLTVILLSGCTQMDQSPLPEEPIEMAVTDLWTREDFKDILDQHEQVEPLIDELKTKGLAPFRETFERVVTEENAFRHIYADVYPFKLDDGTYATIYQNEDGTIANGSDSVPLFWQEEAFEQFVKGIEKRKYGTGSPPEDVQLTKEEFQAIYNRHDSTSSLVLELEEWGAVLTHDPIENIRIKGNGGKEAIADLLTFEIEEAYAVVYNQNGTLLKPSDSVSALFWSEKDLDDFIAQNEIN